MKPEPVKFELLPAGSKNEKEAAAWKEALKAAGDGIGQTLELAGYWKPADTKKSKDALPTLAVTRAVAAKPAEAGK